MSRKNPPPIKPWVIFDFDYTLFDTTEFKKDIFALFRDCGVSESYMASSYKSYLASHDVYDLISHCEYLTRSGVPCSRARVEEFLSHPFEHYLVKGAKEMLKELRAKGHRLILLTKGAERFQLTKIRQAGLASFFDEVRIVRTKEKEIEKMKIPEGSYFINDDAAETERIMRAYPKLHYLLFVDSHTNPAGITISIPKITALREILYVIR